MAKVGPKAITWTVVVMLVVVIAVLAVLYIRNQNNLRTNVGTVNASGEEIAISEEGIGGPILLITQGGGGRRRPVDDDDKGGLGAGAGGLGAGPTS